MYHKNRAKETPVKYLVVMVALTLTLLFSAQAQAQQSSPYELAGQVVAGEATSGGVYTLGVAAGQSGIASVAGGAYDLGGGLFGGGTIAGELIQIFLPLIQR
jgi:hypothetical protein